MKKIKIHNTHLGLWRRLRRGFGLFILFCYFCLSASHAANLVDSLPPIAEPAKKLRIGLTGRIFFQHVSEQGTVSGLDVELSKLIFEKAGFDIQYIFYPWSRIMLLIEAGKLDVALSAADSAERRKFAYFSKQALRQGQNFLFTLDTHAHRFIDVKSLQQLEGIDLRLAVYRGAAYSSEYDKLLSEPWFTDKLVIVDSASRTMESLLVGRAEALLGSEYGMLAYAKQMKLADRLVPVFALMSEHEAQTHIMYSKRTVSEEWVQQIDQAMAELKSNGEYQKVISNFLTTH